MILISCYFIVLVLHAILNVGVLALERIDGAS